MNGEFEAELQKLARSHALLNAADKVAQLTRERDEAKQYAEDLRLCIEKAVAAAGCVYAEKLPTAVSALHSQLAALEADKRRLGKLLVQIYAARDARPARRGDSAGGWQATGGVMKSATQWLNEDGVVPCNQRSRLFSIKQIKAIQLDAFKAGMNKAAQLEFVADTSAERQAVNGYQIIIIATRCRLTEADL